MAILNEDDGEEGEGDEEDVMEGEGGLMQEANVVQLSPEDMQAINGVSKNALASCVSRTQSPSFCS